MRRDEWSREQLLVTFNLYCRVPFGKLHKSNPDIIALAQKIGRTPSAVAMKLVNFASFDPIHQARNAKGLANASRADKAIWEEFQANPEELAYESQQRYWQVMDQGDFAGPDLSESEEVTLPSGPTETIRTVRTRLVQSFFRNAVLSSYNFTCAVCGIDLPELLTASHIIPWKQDIARRADPSNGLSLCSLHDRAFDRGFFTLDNSFSVLLSAKAKQPTESRLQKVALWEIEGQKITLPKRFLPDLIALSYHRERVFIHQGYQHENIHFKLDTRRCIANIRCIGEPCHCL